MFSDGTEGERSKDKDWFIKIPYTKGVERRMIVAIIYLVELLGIDNKNKRNLSLINKYFLDNFVLIKT